MQITSTAFASVFLAVFVAGCQRPESSLSRYESMWVSKDQANPTRKEIPFSDQRSLLNSPEYTEGRILMVEDAVTDELKAQMRSYGMAVDLNGLGEVLTQTLETPGNVARADLAKSAWMLGVRNIFFGVSAGKSVELHYGPSELELLVLRHRGLKTLTCYEEEDGLIREFIFEE